MKHTVRLLTGSTAGILVAGLLIGSAAAAAPPVTDNAPRRPASAGPPSDHTSAREARRVDRVPTPRIDWQACYAGAAECATVPLPLDYDQPNGATVDIAVLRIKARDQQRRIGSLFLNPGGPGGSGVEFGLIAPGFLSDSLLARFDLIGFDPRGVGGSTRMACFTSPDEESRALAGMYDVIGFPYGAAEEQPYVASAQAYGRGCSTTGKTMAGAMSTAEVARDMDVLRRAVGDQKLNYLGFSYGSVLGQYYANMFPDRFRALVIDSVVDPTAWVAGPHARTRPLFDRIGSDDGASRTLREVFARCDAAGPARCSLAGHAAADYALVAERLTAAPLAVELAGEKLDLTYSALVSVTDLALRLVAPLEELMDAIGELRLATDPAADPADRQAATRAFEERLTRWLVGSAAESSAGRAGAGEDPAYQPAGDPLLGVTCTDAVHPRDAASWPRMAAAADRRAPYFGRLWSWLTATCAADTWTARDEDAYRGPFTRRTGAPVLVAAGYWDPATSYDNAVRVAALLPNSRLVRNDSWGHGMYRTSACVTGAIDGYLLDGTLPAEGTVCVGDYQPFAVDRTAGEDPAARTRRAPARATAPPAPGEPKRLPPVTTPPFLSGLAPR